MQNVHTTIAFFKGKCILDVVYKLYKLPFKYELKVPQNNNVSNKKLGQIHNKVQVSPQELVEEEKCHQELVVASQRSMFCASPLQLAIEQ